MASWKRDFASGLIVLGPILITLYVIYWLYGLVAAAYGSRNGAFLRCSYWRP